MSISSVLIDSIVVGDRVRKDMGDIAGLAASIQQHGLLHPPAVTPDGRLIAGHRRLVACRSLGWAEIPVRVIEVSNLLSAERDENAVRKDFTPSEAVAIARAIEDQLRAASKARRSAASKARWARAKGEKVIDVDSTSITPAVKEVAINAAQAVGMGRNRYDQAKEVVEAAEQEAEKFGDLVEAMDASGNVSAAYTELRRRRDNAPARHPVLRRTKRRNAHDDIERAITVLQAVATTVEQIDAASLDPECAREWAANMGRPLAAIKRFLRSMQSEHNCESDASRV